jgi:hypothetical protein
MSYRNTFILVAPDYPATTGQVPVARGGVKTVPVLQYELLAGQPYHFTQDELCFRVHILHKGIDEPKATRGRNEIWKELFSKPQPCLRVSMLAKRYGWGIHYDAEGRIAIWAVDSPEYARLARKQARGPKLLFAVRSKRAEVKT